MQQHEDVTGKSVRDRMKSYAEECQRKKEVERREKLEVGQLDDSMTDVSKFETPGKKAKMVDILHIGKINSPGVFSFELEEEYDPVQAAKERERRVNAMSMRPGMTRGRSFDDDDAPQSSSPPRINLMVLGASFDDEDKPQEVKDREEKSAKSELAALLAKDNKQEFETKTVMIKPFASMRNGYMQAITKLRPESRPFLVHTKAERRQEAVKVKEYNNLQDAWDQYDYVAQDKPDPQELTEAEKKVEAELLKVETEVADEWKDYAEEVVKAVETDNEDDDSEGDDEWDFWIAEAKRLKEEAMRKKINEEQKKRKAEKDKKRRAKEEQLKHLSAEDEDIQATAKRLKEEAMKKKEEEEGGGSKSKPRGKGAYSDSESEDSDDEGYAAKKGGKNKAGKRGGKAPSSDSEDDDSSDDDAVSKKSPKTDDSAAKKAKKGKVKKGKGKFESDSDSDESGGERKSYKKKKKEKEVAPATPTKKKGKADLVEDKLPSPKTPRNQDGTLWKNPLNRWTNKPKKRVKEVNAQITVKVPEKTDCWRKTRHNFIMDNAPYNWHKVTGDFEAIVNISGDFGKMYDKAGIMIREDAENWILSGMEFFNKRMNHSTCVTRDFTDWSLSPLPEGAEKAGVWFCVKRIGNSYECFYSLDGKKWVQTRQGVFTNKAVLKVGICCACPMGVEFKVTFEGYRLKPI